ncbi:MAG: glutathione S-transferase family protein, partial [Solirubrobacterales bacterium]
DYEYRALDSHLYRSVVPEHLGATQYPTVELDDGRWMSDTTPMINWLEQEQPGPSVIPSEPVQRYLSLLVEDYADEWLWRPAMYYRWSFAPDRYLAGTRLAEEVIRIPGVPLAERRRWITRRQKRLFVSGDGVKSSNREHVESSYLNLLGWLETIFTGRPYMLGDRPTIADFGLMGSFWRHFVHDPTPAQLIQERAPAVFEWAARVWNARVSRSGNELILDRGIPDDWDPLLKEIGETHLEALAQNAEAYTTGEKRHDLHVQGVTYGGIPTSGYRPWCLQQLQAQFRELPEEAASEVRVILERHGCWEPLWRVTDFRCDHDPDDTAPFCRATRMVRD